MGLEAVEATVAGKVAKTSDNTYHGTKGWCGSKSKPKPTKTDNLAEVKAQNTTTAQVGGDVTKKANPLDGTTFTDKVRLQMNGKDTDHNFPTLVDNQADAASVKKITGDDGIERTKVELPGSINGKDGNFSWIIEPDKTINHRQFERLKKK